MTHITAFQSASFGTKLISNTQRLPTSKVSQRRLANRVMPRTTPRPRPTMKVYDVEIDMHGTKHNIPIDEELTLLEGIEEYGLEVLYSCRAGVCVTCAAKLLAGEIDPGFASITDDLKAQGYVLTCSAYPRSDGIKLEMNHFDDAYEKQYGQFEKAEKK